MSSSISLVSSTESSNSLAISKSFAHLPRASSKFSQINPSRLSLNRHEARKSAKHSSHKKSQDFYHEVDERMSRNSAEYPEQQAKYVVDNWLNEMRSNSFELSSSESWGNVIGIRGFPDKSPSIHESQRARFNKLKFDYTKLETEYNNLRNQLALTTIKLKKTVDRKDHDIEALKGALLKSKAKRSSQRSASRQETVCQHCEKHQFRIAQLSDSLLAKDEEFKIRLEDKQEEIKSLREELSRVEAKVKSLSLESSNKIILELRSENNRLKELNMSHVADYSALRENYSNVERQLKSILEEQRCLEGRKNEEASKVLVELCRLQVYQPKLEMMLNTERAIKQQLQDRIESFERENEQLRDAHAKQTFELNKERTRCMKSEAVEIDKISKELKMWQERYEKVRSEKGESENLLRSLKNKLALLDAKHQSEIELVREKEKSVRGEAEKDKFKVELENNKLSSTLTILNAKLADLEMERQELLRELSKANEELELAKARKEEQAINMSRVEGNENKITMLLSQLHELRLKNGELLDELEICKRQGERQKQQLQQVQNRFRSQQKAFDELRESKEKELAKLRVNLNFEHYNRQVALKSMERELKFGLRELEAMKERFSRRLAQNNNPKLDCCSLCDFTTQSDSCKMCSRSPKKSGELEENGKEAAVSGSKDELVEVEGGDTS